MSEKPIYYGAPPAASTQNPIYYGSNLAYDSVAYHGNPYGNTDKDPSESIVGKLTLSRILRVLSQRWISIFTFLFIGLVVAFAYYKVSPVIYEAKSEFTMDTRRKSSRAGSTLEQALVDYGSNYTEIFNTRLSMWRSEKIVSMILREYRTSFPASTVTEAEITAALADSIISLERGSRIITITVPSTSPTLAAALANAYASTIETLTDEENKTRCDKAVLQLHLSVEKQRREVEKLSRGLLEFRTAHKVDSLRSTRDMTAQSLSAANAEILKLESEETQLVEFERILSSVQEDPQSFGTLSSGIPRAKDIDTEYRAFQTAFSKSEQLQLTFTENHPDVIASLKETENAKQRFLDATARALQTGRATLQITRNRLSSLATRREDLNSELASISQRILLAESGLSILEADFGVANRVLEDLIMQENQARNDAEANNEVITRGRIATEPKEPSYPKPIIIFAAGIVLSLIAGFFFVLMMDNIEDTIVNLSDIENRLSLKVLSVFPHIRQKTREGVAKLAADDKYSQFSEAVASFRNLLDSPRYNALTKCLLIISTQPGEGKTVTSTSIAISHAQTGKKVLLVDFDLRRPRQGKIWDLSLTEETSFSHFLSRAGDMAPDFTQAVNHSSVPNLDVLASLPPDGISPSTIFGARVIDHFFSWARANYDRIIIDAPPFGIIGDTISLAVKADSVIIICSPDRTRFKPIQFCSRSLTEAGANIIGVIVNDVDISSSSAFKHTHHGEYGSYGYGYGYGYTAARRKHPSATNPDNNSEQAEASSEFADEE